ncbi:MAG: carboxymuconolactone decarboxylase [Rhizobacter sp.]|nr:carboxymuconolactone decarboxylase [Rhizobacter sp.]
MPRLPYITDEQAGPPDLVAAIRQRRNGQLVELDRLLLHSPPFVTGWNAFLGQVRSNLAVSPLLKELAMCAVAVLNGAEYEMFHHAPLYLAEGGTQAELDALRDIDRATGDGALFDAPKRATIRLAIEMTRTVRVSDATFAEARLQLGDDRQLVELIGVIAAYNMVSRFLVALELTP